MTDRRLFDSSPMTPPPAPEIDAVTNNVDSEPILNREYLSTMFRRFLDEQGDAIIEGARRHLEEIEWVPFRRYAHPVVDPLEWPTWLEPKDFLG